MQNPNVVVERFETNSTEKTHVITKPELRNGELVIKKVTLKKVYNNTQKKWELAERQTEYVDLLTGRPELKKRIETEILIMRKAVDTQTLKPLEAYFKGVIEAQIPEGYKNLFLSVSDNLIFLHNWSSYPLVVTQTLSPNDELCRLKDVKRIPTSEARRLFIDLKWLVYTEDQNGKLSVLEFPR